MILLMLFSITAFADCNRKISNSDYITILGGTAPNPLSFKCMQDCICVDNFKYDVNTETIKASKVVNGELIVDEIKEAPFLQVEDNKKAAKKVKGDRLYILKIKIADGSAKLSDVLEFLKLTNEM